jgi:predicted dehydrogenase
VDRLKVAVVGSGFISVRKHLPALLCLRDRVDLVALVDPDEGAARKVAEQFGIARIYEETAEMLEREGPDIVHVCTPPRTHAELAAQAAAARCHVLIEKPMALSEEECDRIISTAAEAGVKLCVAHSDLFYPPVIRARGLMDEGAIGRFAGMRVFLSTPTSYMTSRQDHWAHRLPGGVIGETGPHAVYLTLAFMPSIREVRVLGSSLLDYPWSNFDDYRIDLIGDSAVSSIVSVYTTDQWTAEVDIWGTGGLLRLDLETMSLVRHRRPSLGRGTVAASSLRGAVGLVGSTVRTGAAVLARRYQDTHRMLVERFLDCIRDDTPPPVPPEQGREAVRVMALITEALEGRSAPQPE